MKGRIRDRLPPVALAASHFDDMASLGSVPIRQHRVGESITVIQPHSDDAALSIGGLLARCANIVHLVTAFGGDSTNDIRACEDIRFAALYGFELTMIPEAPSSRTDVRSRVEVSPETRKMLLDYSGQVNVWSPAGVGNHPDHVLVSDIACELGDAWLYWEDVAFWGIYGSSVEDRYEFAEVHNTEIPSEFLIVAVEFDPRPKLAALSCYPSQSVEVWRPLRYATIVSREHETTGHCERVFVRRDRIEWMQESLGVTLRPRPAFSYGGLEFEVLSAPLGRGL